MCESNIKFVHFTSKLASQPLIKTTLHARLRLKIAVLDHARMGGLLADKSQFQV